MIIGFGLVVNDLTFVTFSHSLQNVSRFQKGQKNYFICLLCKMYNIIQKMYIDSPNFVKRKVLNVSNNHSSHIAQQYVLGSEREALTQHVRHQLNQHSSDAQILQKFRKQAQELKRQRFLAKKHQSSPSSGQILMRRTKQIANKNNSPFQSRFAESRFRIQSKIEQEDANPQYRQIQQQQSTRKDNGLVYQYEKLLKSKDKEIKRKQKKLEKSKMVIKLLGGKIEHLKQQRHLASKNQEIEMIKINALIEEMNFKIAENKIAFREELARLKLQLMQPLPQFGLRKRTTKRDSSIPVLRNDKKGVKIYDSERFLQGPSVYYEPPSLQTLDLVQSRIDHNLESVGKGIGRMKEDQKMLESRFQKYKDL